MGHKVPMKVARLFHRIMMARRSLQLSICSLILCLQVINVTKWNSHRYFQSLFIGRIVPSSQVEAITILIRFLSTLLLVLQPERHLAVRIQDILCSYLERKKFRNLPWMKILFNVWVTSVWVRTSTCQSKSKKWQ